ncbi:MAG: allantoicase [Gammaproteobacteria bacterium]|nr:allantoicase [Gammaproteobacteria bacterium]
MTPAIRKWVQLEQPRLGTRVTFATDEFFAAKERLIDPAEPVFIDDKYDDHGKWMDGWESRRRRGPGHDYCVIRLGVPGVIHGFDLDTSHFTGNYPPQASIEACSSNLDVPDEGWVELLPKTDLAGDSHHYLDVHDDRIWSHVRLHIYPDGGVARLRIFGEIRADFTDVDGYVDLVAVEHGGRAVACSDEHYGSMHNLTAPGRGANMGDGWETARRRGPGNDWVILALGQTGVIERAEIDTAHFKGNYPDRVSIEGAIFDSDEQATLADEAWQTLLSESKLKMDQQHYFDDTLQPIGPVSHVRVSIYPDGGISRIRLFGQVHG